MALKKKTLIHLNLHIIALYLGNVGCVVRQSSSYSILRSWCIVFDDIEFLTSLSPKFRNLYIGNNMILLIRIECNILITVIRVELVFELSTVTKTFSFNDKRKLTYVDLQICQFILKVVVSAGILLFWLVK